MPSIFSITTPSQPIALDSQGQGTAVFSVTNTSQRAVSVRCDVSADSPVERGWLRIKGSNSVHLDAGQTSQMVVAIAAPPGAAQGTHTLHLKAFDTERPDENFTESQSASFLVSGTPATPPSPKPNPMIFVAVFAALLVVGGGVGAWLFFSGGETSVEVPSLLGQDFDQVNEAVLADFAVETRIRESRNEQPGTILEQEPEPGELVEFGSALKLLLAAAPAEIPVDDFAGSKLKALQRWADRRGVELNVVEMESDEPEGTILLQEPAEGSIASGEPISVQVAVPRTDIAVEGFVDMQLAQLQHWAETHGIVLDIAKEESDRPEGTIIRQEPASGRMSKERPIQVVVAVRLATIPAPNLISMNPSKIEGTYGHWGLVFVDQTNREAPLVKVGIPTGRINSQDPEVGASIVQGGTIAYTVQPKTTTMPEVTNHRQADALSKLVYAKLLPNQRYERTTDTSKWGLVKGQDPAAGTLLPALATVEITVWGKMIQYVPLDADFVTEMKRTEQFNNQAVLNRILKNPDVSRSIRRSQ
jgi:beta-lactam-binding protein with PASTA domain